MFQKKFSLKEFNENFDDGTMQPVFRGGAFRC